MSTITYKCPNCDGGLVFDPQSGTYACEYCFSKFSQEELVADVQSSEVVQNEPVAEAGTESTQEGAVVYHCPSCGAEIITDETTAATYCFYCHNPIVLEGKLNGSYLPDSIIQFKITKEEATEELLKWIKKKKYAPKGFYSKKNIEKLTGVYFPYWLYDCEIDGSMAGSAKDVRIYTSGNTEYTETKIYDVKREGKISFRHLPKTALQKAQSDLLKGIFPYEFGAMEKFHMGFLAGFHAEKRDIDKEKYIQEIKNQVNDYAEQRMRDTVTGKTSFSVSSQHYQVKKESFTYALLPVWVLTYKAKKDEIYYFAMNGQTGEIVGYVPADSKKLLKLGAIVFAVFFVLFLLGGLLV